MGSLTLTYSDEPADARAGTAPAAADVQDFCTLSDMLQSGNTAPRHATLEDGYWVLGKEFRLFPDEPAGLTWGLFSRSMAGEDGAFAAPVTLALVLDGLYSSVGMTLEFDPYGPTWCCDLQLDWWRDGAVISSREFQPDAWQYVCYNEVKSFDLVTVTFRKMSAPWRYLKLQALTYGITRVFGSGELFNLDLYQDTDLLSDTVSVNTLDFVLRNKSAIAFLFQRKQPLYLREGDSLLGVYYISTAEKSGQNRYDIHAVDMVGLAEMAGDHKGGFYAGVRAADLVADILGTIPWEMDAGLQDVLLYGHLPVASRRDNLQQVAFALCAMVRTARRASIQITRQVTGQPVRELGEEDCYENGSISSGVLVTAVKVTAHSYTQRSESTTLFSGILDGTTELEFSEPVGNLQITGGTIDESNANYAVLSGTGGTVVLTGYPYDHTKTIHTRTNPLRLAGDAENPVAYPDMTLVSAHNVADVLTACYAHHLRLDTVKGKVLTGAEAPGDYVTILTGSDGVKSGHLISMDYAVSAKTAAEVTVLADYEGEDAG